MRQIWFVGRDMFGDGYLFFSVMKVPPQCICHRPMLLLQDSETRTQLGSGVNVAWICFACIAAIVSSLCLYATFLMVGHDFVIMPL